MKYHALFVIFRKQQILKLTSALARSCFIFQSAVRSQENLDIFLWKKGPVTVSLQPPWCYTARIAIYLVPMAFLLVILCALTMLSRHDRTVLKRAPRHSAFFLYPVGSLWDFTLHDLVWRVCDVFTLCYYLVIFACFICGLLIFHNQLFKKNLSGIPLECQIDWIQIRPDILSGMVWVQTVCKSYQQMTLYSRQTLANNKV